MNDTPTVFWRRQLKGTCNRLNSQLDICLCSFHYCNILTDAENIQFIPHAYVEVESHRRRHVMRTVSSLLVFLILDSFNSDLFHSLLIVQSSQSASAGDQPHASSAGEPCVCALPDEFNIVFGRGIMPVNNLTLSTSALSFSCLLLSPHLLSFRT